MRGKNRVSSRLLLLASIFFIGACGNGKDPAFTAAGKINLQPDETLKLKSEGGNIIDVLPGAARLEVFKNRVVLDNGLARMPFFFDPKSFGAKHAIYAVTNLSSDIRKIGSGFSMKQPVDLLGRKIIEVLKVEEVRSQHRCKLREDVTYIQVGDVLMPQYNTVYGVQDIVEKVTTYKETYFFSLVKIGEKEELASFDAELPLQETREIIKILSDCH